MRAWSVRRWVVVSGGLALVAFVAFVVVWFQPQKLVIDKRVNERSPLAVVETPASPASPGSAAIPAVATPMPMPAMPAVEATPRAPAAPFVFAAGAFIDGEHST